MRVAVVVERHALFHLGEAAVDGDPHVLPLGTGHPDHSGLDGSHQGRVAGQEGDVTLPRAEDDLGGHVP